MKERLNNTQQQQQHKRRQRQQEREEIQYNRKQQRKQRRRRSLILSSSVLCISFSTTAWVATFADGWIFPTSSSVLTKTTTSTILSSAVICQMMENPPQPNQQDEEHDTHKNKDNNDQNIDRKSFDDCRHLLPFDAHNHVQLGILNRQTTFDINDLKHTICGMAIMSTHPRDYAKVLELSSLSSTSSSSSVSATLSSGSSNSDGMTLVPCLGVHPWFLHELTQDDWTLVESSVATSISSTATDSIDDLTTTPLPDDKSTIATTKQPRWVVQLEELLIEHPQAMVGEIGLDNFHFSDPTTKELSTPLEVQIRALEYQLELAIRYNRPVSVHCVRAMGPMMDCFARFQNRKTKRKSTDDENTDKCMRLLPPRIYFHAFGGKVGTIPQLTKGLEKKSKKSSKNSNIDNDKDHEGTKVYFGFAPVINFQSKKTAEAIRAVGLDRLVLETDHEDVANVIPSMGMAIEEISKTLEVTTEELIERTNRNVQDLYFPFFS